MSFIGYPQMKHSGYEGTVCDVFIEISFDPML